MTQASKTASKTIAALLVLAVAVVALTAVFSSAASPQTSPQPSATVPGADGCFDGTYVATSEIRAGANNDLADDCQNLIAVKNHWGSALNSWGSSQTTNISDWSGVTLGTNVDPESNNRVTRLELSSLALTGAIPAAIGNLLLERLDLSNNQLSGTLPSWLKNLFDLTHLKLNGNRFTGSIPRELGERYSLNNLGTLLLQDNRLSGQIPSELNNLAPSQGGSLYEFGICNNYLTGALPQHLRRSDITLTNYPRDEGFDPVRCQRAPSTAPTTPPTSSTTTTTTSTTTTTTTTTSAPGETPTTEAPAQGESSYYLSQSLEAECITGTLVRPRGILSPDPRVPGPNNDLVDDCLALLEFRENTLISAGSLYGWNDRTHRTPLSAWTGVAISNGRVTTLNLRGLSIQGDAEQLSAYPGFDAVPGLASLGKLTALTILDISDNYFSGIIPDSIGELPNLRTFAFCDNTLTGSVPASLRSGVHLVNYPANLGYDPVRCQRGQASSPTSSTTTTTTSSTTTTTTTSTTTTTTTTTTPRRRATVTGADGCFDGTFLPESVPTRPGENNDLADDCQNLIAVKNHMQSITSWWGSSEHPDMSEWFGVTMSGGRVTGLNLAPAPYKGVITFIGGTIAPEIGNLTALTDLRLNSNKYLTGQMPRELCNLRNLRRLDVDINQLSGTLPSCFGSMPRLEILELDGNRFTGSIPPELGSLDRLWWLDVSENRLSGNIPSQLADLAPSRGGSLRRLDICNNDLTGSLPSALRAASINLANYPRDQGFEPVRCQRTSSTAAAAPPASSTTTTTTSTTTTTTTAATTTTTTATTTATTTPDATTTTTTTPRVSVCDPDEREWPALSVDQGGASIAAIRNALFDGSTTQAIYRWYSSRGEWARVLSTTGHFPEGRVISLRCVTTDAATLNRLNLLGGTRQIALRENTNLIVAPEDLARPEGARSSFFIAEELFVCRPASLRLSSGITLITIRSSVTGEWSISVPCNQALENLFIATGRSATVSSYEEVSEISQGDIIYLRFVTTFPYSDNYDIHWNSETSQYEAGTGSVAAAG